MILYFILFSSVLHSLFFPLPFPTRLSFPSPLTTTLPFPPLLLFPYFLSLSFLTHEIWKIIKQNLRNTNSKAVKIILKAWMLNSVLNFHTCMPGGWITLFFQRRLTDPNLSCRRTWCCDCPVLLPSLHIPNSPSAAHGLGQPSHVQDQEAAAPESTSEMPWGKFSVSANSEWECSFLICPPKKRSKTWLM